MTFRQSYTMEQPKKQNKTGKQKSRDREYRDYDVDDRGVNQYKRKEKYQNWKYQQDDDYDDE